LQSFDGTWGASFIVVVDVEVDCEAAVPHIAHHLDKPLKMLVFRGDDLVPRFSCLSLDALAIEAVQTHDHRIAHEVTVSFAGFEDWGHVVSLQEDMGESLLRQELEVALVDPVGIARLDGLPGASESPRSFGPVSSRKLRKDT